jgi:hypothetical protein
VHQSVRDFCQGEFHSNGAIINTTCAEYMDKISAKNIPDCSACGPFSVFRSLPLIPSEIERLAKSDKEPEPRWKSSQMVTVDRNAQTESSLQHNLTKSDLVIRLKQEPRSNWNSTG